MKSKSVYSKNNIISYVLTFILLFSGRAIFSQTNNGVRGDLIAIYTKTTNGNLNVKKIKTMV